MPTETDRLHTPRTASKKLGGVPEKTLANWRWRGIGPRFVKIGKRVLYRDCDLQAFIVAQVRASTSDAGSQVA